jgi:Carboxypeptidase regulatory-like domain
MRFSTSHNVFVFGALITLLVILPASLLAQSVVSGDITGTVTDSSGAVVMGATVTLKGADTGVNLTDTTSQSGSYRFPLLKPGRYTVGVAQRGFKGVSQTVTVSIGQATTVNIKLDVGSQAEVVEVTGEGSVLQTENSEISTSFSATQLGNAPNPGGDLTYVAQTAPGVLMNTQGGYGNFSAFGLPADSNVFTVNGMNEMDPYLNLNNSGATNLLLGVNDVSEATVVNNAYSGQYGQLAGTQVNYVSKSGTNSYHGNAIYNWNGRALNANSFFNNQAGVKRSFTNANQYAASFGGPIKKDKTFFFVDYEGLKVVIPTSSATYIPTPQYSAAVIANLNNPNGANLPNSVPFYQKMFSLWSSAKGASGAVPFTLNDDANLGCDDINGDVSSGSSDPNFAGFGAQNGGTTAGIPCVAQFRSTAGNYTHEWILVGRIDQNFSDKDHVNFRYRMDRGVQATYTDPISPVFNAFSTQPQYEGQSVWNHIFSPNMTNQFIASGSWYSAVFNASNPNSALGAYPYTAFFNFFSGLGGEDYVFPQGRNVTQVQLVDDLSWTRGKHTLKFGANYRRNDISDYIFGVLNTPEYVAISTSDFSYGIADELVQRFPTKQVQPMALYELGIYGTEEWRATAKLKLTGSLRFDHNSNPVCQTNCFARWGGPFASDAHDVNAPYNSTIHTGLHAAFPGTDPLAFQPRVGFAWTPVGDKTVVRGGAGIFIDSFPAVFLDRFARNSPNVNQFIDGAFVDGNADPLSPAETNSALAQLAASNQVFVQQFSNGGTYASISTALAPIPFSRPTYSTAENTIHTPRYEEWNLEVQQQLTNNMLFSLNYVGNHGYWIPILYSANMYAAGGFTAPGLTTSRPDARFGQVSEVTSSSTSHYNGLTASIMKRLSSGLQFQASYTWSHALDSVSNGGINPYGGDSLQWQEINGNLKAGNYGNADYDARHGFNASYLWQPKAPAALGAFGRQVLGGWSFSETFFVRSGLPYTVQDSVFAGTHLKNFGGQYYANFLGGSVPSCSGPGLDASNTHQCLTTSMFNDSVLTFSGQRRNQFRGPGFFDSDFTVVKNFNLGEKAKFGLGFNFYNVFNHPNFANPNANLTGGNFGQITATVSPATSALGSFLGADQSPRFIQLKATISF